MPSSTMIIEVVENDGQLGVEVFFNDEPISFSWADGKSTVNVDDFIKYLDS